MTITESKEKYFGNKQSILPVDNLKHLKLTSPTHSLIVGFTESEMTHSLSTISCVQETVNE